MARVYTKGAPDMLFPMLSGVLDSDMNVHGLDEATTYDGENCTEIEKLNKVVVKFAKQAYRTILLCKKDMTMDEYNQMKADHNNFASAEDKECLEVGGLMALGIFALQDPLRGDIKNSIALVRIAGIQVIMATGDNIDTAIAISKNANIIEDKHIAASP
jgi:P-type E1-E2 ATPase